MFDASETKQQDRVFKQEFDKANRILLASNLRLGDDVDYMVFEVALGTAHTNEAIGLLANSIIADSFTVLSAPNTATIRINSPSANAITAIQGWRRQGKIRELYVTNSVAGGVLQIEVTWTSQDKMKTTEAAEIAVAQKEAAVEVKAPVVMKKPEAAGTSPWVTGGLMAAGLGMLGMIVKSGRKQ